LRCWLRFWSECWQGFWFRRLSEKGFVGDHPKDKDGVARADFVPVGESGFFDARAVEESAVAALQVQDAAAFFAVVDGEVKADIDLSSGKA